jgi:hypothetical protein
MVVYMSFTKKVKTVNCEILIITYIFFVNLLLTLTIEPLITCQSISLWFIFNDTHGRMVIY